ncbi:hypothetical protein H4S06_001316, partial [Coemansia sp. BCRC 34490]
HKVGWPLRGRAGWRVHGSGSGRNVLRYADASACVCPPLGRARGRADCCPAVRVLSVLRDAFRGAFAVRRVGQLHAGGIPGAAARQSAGTPAVRRGKRGADPAALVAAGRRVPALAQPQVSDRLAAPAGHGLRVCRRQQPVDGAAVGGGSGCGGCGSGCAAPAHRWRRCPRRRGCAAPQRDGHAAAHGFPARGAVHGKQQRGQRGARGVGSSQERRRAVEGRDRRRRAAHGRRAGASAGLADPAAQRVRRLRAARDRRAARPELGLGPGGDSLRLTGRGRRCARRRVHVDRRAQHQQRPEAGGSGGANVVVVCVCVSYAEPADVAHQQCAGARPRQAQRAGERAGVVAVPAVSDAHGRVGRPQHQVSGGRQSVPVVGIGRTVPVLPAAAGLLARVLAAPVSGVVRRHAVRRLHHRRAAAVGRVGAALPAVLPDGARHVSAPLPAGAVLWDPVCGVPDPPRGHVVSVGARSDACAVGGGLGCSVWVLVVLAAHVRVGPAHRRPQGHAVAVVVGGVRGRVRDL